MDGPQAGASVSLGEPWNRGRHTDQPRPGHLPSFLGCGPRGCYAPAPGWQLAAGSLTRASGLFHDVLSLMPAAIGPGAPFSTEAVGKAVVASRVPKFSSEKPGLSRCLYVTCPLSVKHGSRVCQGCSEHLPRSDADVCGVVRRVGPKDTGRGWWWFGDGPATVAQTGCVLTELMCSLTPGRARRPPPAPGPFSSLGCLRVPSQLCGDSHLCPGLAGSGLRGHHLASPVPTVPLPPHPTRFSLHHRPHSTLGAPPPPLRSLGKSPPGSSSSDLRISLRSVVKGVTVETGFWKRDFPPQRCAISTIPLECVGTGSFGTVPLNRG